MTLNKEEVNCERHMTMRLYLAGLTSKEVNFGHKKICKITISAQSHLDFIFFFCVELIVSYSCCLNSTQSPMMHAWHGLDTAAIFFSSTAVWRLYHPELRNSKNSFISREGAYALMFGHANSNCVLICIYAYVHTHEQMHINTLVLHCSVQFCFNYIFL